MTDSYYLRAEFVKALESGLRKIDTGATASGRFPVVSCDPSSVYESLKEIKQLLSFLYPARKRFTFLDAGCGYGEKVFLAKKLGFEAYGIEIFKPSVSVARLVCGKENIINTNLLTYKEYEQFDVVFMFRPLYSHELETKFEERLVRYTKPEVIILSAGHDLYLYKHTKCVLLPFSKNPVLVKSAMEGKMSRLFKGEFIKENYKNG